MSCKFCLISPGTFRSAATVTIEITGINDAPVANNDGGNRFNRTVSHSSFTTTNALNNDTDVDSPVLTVQSIDTTGTLGLVTDLGDGTFFYDPNGAFDHLNTGDLGIDTFTYTISDGDGGTDTATFTIQIEGITDTPGVNDPPIANDDGGSRFFRTDENTIKSTTSLLSNDRDPENDPLTIVNIDAVGTLGGTVTLRSSNGVLYDPNGQFEGLKDGETVIDTFTYTISDGALTDTATVSIEITGINDAPVANNDGGNRFNRTVSHSSFTTTNALNNDTDVDSPVLTVQSIDTTGTLGLVTDLGDGTFFYDPNGAFDHLNTGDLGIDTFTYTISDGDGGTDTATFTIQIEGITDTPGVNDPPIANDDGGSRFFRTDENTIKSTTSLLSNDRDPENDPLTIVNIDAVGTLGGLITLRSTNGVFYDPNGQFEDLISGESRFDTFEYTISDGALTDTATVTIEITGVDDPVNAVSDAASVHQAKTVTGNVITNDIGVDGGLNISGISFGGSAGTVGTALAGASGILTVEANGDFNYTANANAVTGATDVFTYELSDRDGSTDTTTVTFTIINAAPNAVDFSFGTQNENIFGVGFPNSYILSNDSDPDNDTLTIVSVDDSGLLGSIIFDPTYNI